MENSDFEILDRRMDYHTDDIDGLAQKVSNLQVKYKALRKLLKNQSKRITILEQANKRRGT